MFKSSTAAASDTERVQLVCKAPKSVIVMWRDLSFKTDCESNNWPAATDLLQGSEDSRQKNVCQGEKNPWFCSFA